MEKINVSSKIKLDSGDEYILVEKIFLEKDGFRNTCKKLSILSATSLKPLSKKCEYIL